MKLSKTTLDILRNFASINQNILINPGKKLTTRAVAKNIFAEANIEDEFDTEFGIYNLTELLGVISLFSEPEFELSESSMTISQDKNKVQYVFANPEVLDYPDKEFKAPVMDIEFELTEDNLKSLQKAGAVLSATDLKISSSNSGTEIFCTVLDPKNPSSNTFTIDVGSSESKFEVFIKLENLKMIPGNYIVNLSSKKVALFKNKTIDYKMYIACEKNSVWN